MMKKKIETHTHTHTHTHTEEKYVLTGISFVILLESDINLRIKVPTGLAGKTRNEGLTKSKYSVT